MALWVEIARTIDDADIGQLGLRLARQEPQDLLTQCGGGHRGVEHLEHGNAHPGEHRMPTAFGRDFERRQPGFLGQLPQHAAIEVNLTGVDIMWIRRPADKIHLSGVGRVVGHDAEEKSAVSATQRRHAEAIADRTIWKIPISPRQKAGEIGLKIIAMENVWGERKVVQHQDAAVPQMRVVTA